MIIILLSIRQVEINDAPALSNLFREFINTESNIKKIEKQIEFLLMNSHYYIPVVCDKDKIVGTAMGIVCFDLVGECNSFMLIENVVVDPIYRRKGVGRLLINSIEDFGIQNNCKYIILVSEIEREESHRFYESLGYTSDQQGFKKRLKGEWTS